MCEIMFLYSVPFRSLSLINLHLIIFNKRRNFVYFPKNLSKNKLFRLNNKYYIKYIKREALKEYPELDKLK